LEVFAPFLSLIPRRLVAILALVGLVAAGAGADYSLFHCRTRDITQLECCCKKTTASTSDSPTTVVAADCCDVYAVHVDRAPSATRPSPDVVLAPRALMPFAALVFLPPVVQLRRVVSTRAPGVGPPMILLKQSFLV
jgi:hypothetical protein